MCVCAFSLSEFGMYVPMATVPSPSVPMLTPDEELLRIRRLCSSEASGSLFSGLDSDPGTPAVGGAWVFSKIWATPYCFCLGFPSNTIQTAFPNFRIFGPHVVQL